MEEETLSQSVHGTKHDKRKHVQHHPIRTPSKVDIQGKIGSYNARAGQRLVAREEIKPDASEKNRGCLLWTSSARQGGELVAGRRIRELGSPKTSDRRGQNVIGHWIGCRGEGH